MATNINEPRDDKFKVQWLKFWDSEMGKVAIQDLRDLTTQLAENALKAPTTEQAMYYVGRAAGVEYALDYIMTGIEAGKQVEREAKKKVE